MKKLLILIPFILFSFQSTFTPHLNKYFSNLKCDITLHKDYFDICYSCKDKKPNAVAYILRGNFVNKNNLSRRGLRFKPDYNLPRKCRSYSKDYTHTGYDRGHNAPNAAFDFSKKAQKQTFLMSNIAPQAKWLNRRYWAKLERLARFLAVKYKQIEVVTGSCGVKEKLKNNVTVPAYWYKVIYIPTKNDMLVFLAPNTNTGMKRAKIKKFKNSIEELRKVCGF